MGEFKINIIKKSLCCFVCLAFIMLYMTTDAHAQQQDTRPFLMSFTYQPYDWSEDAFSKTHQFIQNNADATFFYFDDGVPWPEALNSSPFHENVNAHIKEHTKQTKKNDKVFVGVNFLGKDRTSLASYWGQEDSMPLPDGWSQKSLDDPDVVTAYTKYCKRMIKSLKPDIFVYGMEIDSIQMDIKDKNFVKLKFFLNSVYKELKKEFPDLTLVLTFVLLPEKDMQPKKDMIKELLPYTDIYAVSLYPYLFDGIAGDAFKLPDNLFSQIGEYIGDKPFAIAETGFNAKRWSVLSKLIWISGNEKSQTHYVRFLLEEANKLDAVFVNWWVPRDLDKLWKKMKASGADPVYSQWNSNGLLKANGEKRPSYFVWHEWYQKKIRN